MLLLVIKGNGIFMGLKTFVVENLNVLEKNMCSVSVVINKVLASTRSQKIDALENPNH